MAFKKCNKCQFQSADLDWNRELYAKEGIWRLSRVVQSPDGTIKYIPHICTNSVENTPMYNEPLIECQYCEMYHACRGQKDMDEHVSKYHPNGEIRYEYDFYVISPKDEDSVLRKCQECTRERGYKVAHCYKYGQVKGIKEVVCIRHEKS